MASAKRAAAAAQRRFNAAPSDLTAALSLHRARGRLSQKQAAYDASPDGQRELQDAIAALGRRRNLTAAAKTDAWSAPELDRLRTRLAAGRQTRLAQKKASAAAQGLSDSQARTEVDKQLNRLRHPDQEFVVHAPQGREASIGFVVPGWEDRKVRCGARELTAACLLDFYRQNRHLLARTGHFVTAWHNAEAGTVTIAPAVTTTAAETARTLCARMGQALFHDSQLGHTVKAA